MFALRLWLSATPETDAPSCEHCCRTWAFNCALYARRLGTSSVDSLSIVSTISFVYTMPYLANRLKMGSPPAYLCKTASDWLLTSMAFNLEVHIWQGAATAEIRDRSFNLELTGLRRRGAR